MKKLVIIDSHGLIHRAFHALPPLTTPQGEPIGAVYGLATMVLKIIRKHNPDYIAAAFDRPEPTFRKELYKEYKAHRPSAPDELVGQFNKARELFSIFNIPILEYPGFEADDIIGTLVKIFSKQDLSIIILTSDLDMLQLLKNPSVLVETPQKGVGETKTYNESAVKERFGVQPSQFTDYKGLVGDPSDNIPGVPGVGPKTASKALQEFGDISNLFKNIKQNTPLFKKLGGYEKQALFSKKLATIRDDVPLPTHIEELEIREPSPETLSSYFSRIGFQSIIKRLGLPEKKAAKLISDRPINRKAIDLAETEKQESLFLENKKTDDPIFYEKDTPKKLLEKSGILKIAFDWKPIIKEAYSQNTRVADPLFDIRIAAWLLDPENKITSYEEVMKKYIRSDGAYAMKDLYTTLSKELETRGLIKIFKELEMPLIKILAHMEMDGILVNKEKLALLHKKISREIETLAEKIYKMANMTFNINSPQQVADILFNKLAIKTQKKRTGTGQLKTGRDVLEETKDQHPIIPLLLLYREYFKIDSGFVVPLLELADKNGKIHTTYLQTGTATGRISSEKPNLQNIPQESRWSEDVRNVFESAPKKSFVSFDYSQIELRLLAHISGDDGLKMAFHKNQDIHSLTAMRVFCVSKSLVTKAMRRVGKTLNFGVVYGMGPRAFSKTSGIPLEEAKKIIENYFKNFPRVKTWQNDVIESVKKKQYAENLNGRKRWFSGNALYAGKFERSAINMPIQGLGADILKQAMIETSAMLEKSGEEARLLLSIHDELLFEISDDILDVLAPRLKKRMESVVSISVPLVVETKRGKCWGAMKMF